MISVILPTVRPELYKKAVASIFGSTKEDIEIVTVSNSDKVVDDNRIKWFVRPKEGTVKAINEAYKNCSGDYIFLTNDETVIEPGCLETLMHFCMQHQNNIIATPKHFPEFPFFYYGRRFAAFPFAHKNFIKLVGQTVDYNFFDARLNSFYADPDLSMRTWELGYGVIECPNAVIHHNNVWDDTSRYNYDKFNSSDRDIFSSRWSKFGQLVEPV